MGAPYIYFTTMIPFSYAYELTGAALPASFVPFPFGPPRTVRKLSFYDRMENALLDIHFALFSTYDYIPALERVYKKHLGEHLPSAREIQKNVSLVYSNSHFALNAPAPILPDVIEVAGMHCRPAKPLPKDLDEFLSGAKDGFVYFSMGSIVQSKNFPEYLRKQFVAVFSRLKQRVLWKFETQFEDLPPNVKISKWLPQQDILGHPNIKLFITHGGALSTQESIYHGVPLVAIPIYDDQNSNAKLAASKGYAIDLELLELDEEKLEGAINKILTDPSYTNKAKEISTYFRDQPIQPLDKAVYWAEYVIRHKGTKHLQSSARQLNFIEYYLLDVIAFLGSILVLLLLALFSILKFVYRLITQPKRTNNATKKHQ
jgi:glucuronosyltransferase